RDARPGGPHPPPPPPPPPPETGVPYTIARTQPKETNGPPQPQPRHPRALHESREHHHPKTARPAHERRPLHRHPPPRRHTVPRAGHDRRVPPSVPEPRHQQADLPQLSTH